MCLPRLNGLLCYVTSVLAFGYQFVLHFVLDDRVLVLVRDLVVQHMFLG